MHIIFWKVIGTRGDDLQEFEDPVRYGTERRTQNRAQYVIEYKIDYKTQYRTQYITQYKT